MCCASSQSWGRLRNTFKGLVSRFTGNLGTGTYLSDYRVNQDLEIFSEGHSVEYIYSAVGILTFGISIIPDQVRSLRGSMENLPRK